MQERIDDVNQVVREQITGIRVVRAFVREPHEAERFDVEQRQPTPTSWWAGLITVISRRSSWSSSTLECRRAWFGASRVDDGDMQIG